MKTFSRKNETKFFLLFILVLHFCCLSPLYSFQIQEKEGKLDFLKKYVGDRSHERLFADPSLKKSMRQMLKNEYKRLLDNISVTSPVNLIDGNLVISGNAPHKGDEERGIIVIELYSGQIHVGFFSNGLITIYSSEENYKYLPNSLIKWVDECNAGFQLNEVKKPNNVRLLK
ncbi:MAG: hypothetical protein WC879_02920 [Melioribacteraceae bacterium]